MNREQAALYSKIEEQFPGTLKILHPDIPVGNYKFIKAFGEGKMVKPIDSSISPGILSFMSKPEYYTIAQPERYCNGVMLDDCLQPGDELPDIVFVPNPTDPCGYYKMIIRSDPHHFYTLLKAGLCYKTKDSAVKHRDAMMIIQVRDD